MCPPRCHLFLFLLLLLLFSPGQRATLHPRTASGLSPSQRPPLSLPLQTTCRCWTPSPQLVEHCIQTDRQTDVSDGGKDKPAHPDSCVRGIFADDSVLGAYYFLRRIFSPILSSNPTLPSARVHKDAIPCLILSFPTNLNEKHRWLLYSYLHPYETSLPYKHLPLTPSPHTPPPDPLCSRGVFPPPSPAHLRPGARPPLGRAGQAAAGPSRLGPLPGAVLGVQGAVGAVPQVLHALHRPRLHPQLAAGPAAGAPLLRHPPAGGKTDTAKVLEAMPTLGSSKITPTEGMRAPQAGQGVLTQAGSTPGGCSADGSASASCHCRRSSYAPSGCRSSAGSRTWCTGCLGRQSMGSEAMGAGVPPAPHPTPPLHPRQHTCSQLSPLRWDPSGASPRLAEDACVGAGPPSLLGSSRLPRGAHTERSEADTAFSPSLPQAVLPKAQVKTSELPGGDTATST